MGSAKKMSNKAFTTLWGVILGIVFVVAAGVTIWASISYGTITMTFGGQKYKVVGGDKNADTQYFKSIYNSPDEATAGAKATTVLLEEEGITLLKNNASALPLASGAKVTLFGRNSVDAIYGGGGSGNVDTTNAATFESALTAAGFNLNPATVNFYKEVSKTKGPAKAIGTLPAWAQFAPVYFNPYQNAAIVMDLPFSSTFHISEPPVAEYPADVTASYAEYKDAAIVVFGRGGGEGGDMSRDVYKDMSGYPKDVQNEITDWLARLGIKQGQHQLELSQNEIDLLDHIRASGFEKIVVLVNSSEALELGFIDDSSISAALWIGSPGEGLDAVGSVLAGKVNPSGRLVDTYAYDLTTAPSFNNFGLYQYDNLKDSHFVEYKEGIYVGYRYYETRYGNSIDYSRIVQYPFGYGLSYTTFDWSVVNAPANAVDANGNISVDVRVRNTGNVAGKDVVQLYFTPPYTTGGIEKSSIVLADFAKTGLLQPGAEETVRLSFKARDMASYDYNDANNNGFKGWELEAGSYSVKVARNAHAIVSSIPLTVASSVQYAADEVTGTQIVNQFDDVSDHIKVYLSRANWEGTFPKQPDNFTADEQVLSGAEAYVATAHNNPDDVAPTFNAKNGLQLVDVRGLAYDDPKWEQLLDQVDINEFVNLFRTGAYNTAFMKSVGKPVTKDLDGPAGLSSLIGGKHATAWPSEVVVASTWNKDLARQMGEGVGEESLQSGSQGWYAPAMNNHRSPFAGRNFEYYSEDGVLGGKIAASVVQGSVSKGVLTYIKHFALNDQETGRTGIFTWANEQAMREIYLRPFEIAVKEGNANAVMSAFPRIGTTWAGGSPALLTNVLRDEWGFKGLVITDYNLFGYMYPDQGLRAGNDFMLTNYTPPVFDKTPTDLKSATAKIAIREACHNILYAVANSNAMNGIAPGSTIKLLMPTWVKLMIAADILIALILCCGINFVLKRNKENG
ncbi:MAG: glycoside hydrolase family 3 protein [Treponemataceae bacterium]|nr:MAG: glycoside hydrolase family 3 protein [Treponemataceae bacterium]